ATLAALAQGRMFANGQHLIASPSLVGCAVGGGRAGAAGPTAESIIEMPLLAQIYSPGVCLRGPSSVATNPSPAAATVHFRAGVRLSRRSVILRVLPRFRRARVLVRFRPSWPWRFQETRKIPRFWSRSVQRRPWGANDQRLACLTSPPFGGRLDVSSLIHILHGQIFRTNRIYSCISK